MYKSQEPRQTPEISNDAPLNKAKEIKVEIRQKGGILTPKYVKTSPSAFRLIGNEKSMQRTKSDNNMQQRMFESKQLAQSEMVQDLPKEENQELVIQDHKKLERYTSDLGSNRMEDNTVIVYIARKPKNEIKEKEISKEKEMQEERLAETET